ncbi:MAG TPA: GNAT family N-acetyltransferase [Acidimicrobiales bacterium]|nr:GNAT family N-acetyltransferase [Acidimicrobiales bacterium]
MTVRRLGPGDTATAEEACQLFEDDGPLDVRRFLARAEAALFVAEDDGGVCGWIYGHELVHPDGESTMLLYSLDVDESAQRRGHGRDLVTAFVHHARSIGCTEVWVLTDDDNEAALATYASAGGVRDADPSVMFVWKLAEGRHS